MPAEQSMTIPGRYEAIRSLCEFVAAGAREAGLDDDAVYHLELCCDEASTNIIEHAYGGESVGEIVARYSFDGHAFTVTLQDTGKPFKPESVSPPAIPEDPGNLTGEQLSEQLQIGGLGLHFIRQLMDSVTFEFDPEAGNKLTMVKQVASQEDA